MPPSPSSDGAAVRQPYGGVVGRTVAESRPWWPEPRPPGRPNVVVVLLDDVGFAQLGCFGSSISTPAMDALAAGGIRYRNFHVAALCSPTRASLLTGRNHHDVGVGFLAAFDTGFPNYRGQISPDVPTLPELLRGEGYGTYAAGKWHLAPPTHLTPAGPFHQWPTGRGFDRYYGFLGGEEDQYTPELVSDQHRVEVPDRPDYHLSADLVDRSQQFLADHLSARPDDPFFLYLAFGACHAPHQAPREFIDAYRGAFDHGWDVERERVLARQLELGIVPAGTELAPRNPDVRAWDELDDAQRRLYSRMQEVFAGFMTHTDTQIGRLVQFLREHDELDDTVVLLMSDNGASGEGGEHGTANEYRWFLRLPDSFEDSLAAIDDLGGPRAHNHYPTGWAQAGNTPGKYYKRFAHAGGVRSPLIVHWPARVRPDAVPRSQFCHVTDVVPSVLEACGVDPAGLTLHGSSLTSSWTDAEAPAAHPVQYFETAGHRGIYRDGWKAVAAHETGTDFDRDRWELYDVSSDVSEVHDLAAERPELLDDLVRLWWREAEANGVLPLDDRMQARAQAMNPATDRRRYVLLPGSRLANHIVGPGFAERSFVVRAEVCRSDGDEGVLLAWGRQPAGFSFFVQDGRLLFDYNLAGDRALISSAGELPSGELRLELVVTAGEGGARAELRVDGSVVGSGRLPRPVPGGMGLLVTQCGHNSPSAVSPLYRAPFAYSGRLRRVVVDLAPRDAGTAEAEWLEQLSNE